MYVCLPFIKQTINPGVPVGTSFRRDNKGFYVATISNSLRYFSRKQSMTSKAKFNQRHMSHMYACVWKLHLILSMNVYFFPCLLDTFNISLQVSQTFDIYQQQQTPPPPSDPGGIQGSLPFLEFQVFHRHREAIPQDGSKFRLANSPWMYETL